MSRARQFSASTRVRSQVLRAPGEMRTVELAQVMALLTVLLRLGARAAAISATGEEVRLAHCAHCMTAFFASNATWSCERRAPELRFDRARAERVPALRRIIVDGPGVACVDTAACRPIGETEAVSRRCVWGYRAAVKRQAHLVAASAWAEGSRLPVLQRGSRVLRHRDTGSVSTNGSCRKNGCLRQIRQQERVSTSNPPAKNSRRVSPSSLIGRLR